MITVAISAVAAATYANFSDGKVLTSNTFATGNVYLGAFNVTNLNVTGLNPGTTVTIPNVAINYVGSINADLYIGARGTTAKGAHGYLADKLWLEIDYQGTSSVAWAGWVEDLSSNWKQIANNTSAGWQAYDLKFTLDPSAGNSYEGVTNTDTQILIYAVQHGGSVPSTVPYLTTDTGWF